jgi:hypothetical protein
MVAIELESEASSLHLKQSLVSLPKEETSLVALVRAALNEPRERFIELVHDWLVDSMQGQPRNEAPGQFRTFHPKVLTLWQKQPTTT